MYQMNMIAPFGVELINDQPGRPITDIPAAELDALVEQHKIVLLRGFELLEPHAFKQFASSFGPMLSWKEFGEILDLRVEERPANHIFSSGRVEMHWDGAYVDVVPHYSVFQCLHSANEDGGGGETLFSDCERLLEGLSAEEFNRWQQVEIQYSTAKAAHYGGHISVPLIGAHPLNGQKTVRFIEPENEDNMEVNPVHLRVLGLDGKADESEFLRGITKRIYDPDVMYAHAWRTGDFLLADNHALLHGRAKLRGNTSRHVQRIQVLNR